MTREEAISVLERVAHTESKWPGTEDTLEALDMAISAIRTQQELESKLRVLESSDMFDKDGGEILNGETVTYRHQMTNADRIRAMSDEEMLQWITAGENCVMTICDHICGGECNAIATFKKSAVVACKEIVTKWLRQPAEEVDHV